MSFIVLKRKKGWTKSMPDASLVHPDINCNKYNIRHIYNNWVQPRPKQKSNDKLCAIFSRSEFRDDPEQTV